MRILRSASACALPRPSAMASAKLANRQVNHSQRQICRLKPEKSRNRKSSIRIEPIQTMNITRFLISSRGSSLRNASTSRLPHQRRRI